MPKKKRARHPALEAKPYNPEQYEIEEDLRSVARAKAVNGDPERLKKVKALAKTKLDEFKRRKEEAQTGIDLAESQEKS